MREINVQTIKDAVKEMAIEVNYSLEPDVTNAISRSCSCESCDSARYILEKIQQNIEIAKNETIPLCQDTGLACVFLEVGQEVSFIGGYIYDAINEGVREGYQEGYLRKSVVCDPLRRVNTGDNTPAHIHVELVPGDKVTITFAAKGFGSENMSRVAMLPPSAGKEGVGNFVLETVRLAGGNPCPPMVIGVGIGGTFDSVALNAKKALMIPMDHSNEDEFYAEMEKDLLQRINQLGIGPQGFGGDTTALGINIIAAPTHIAGLPVAVNVNCHVSRHKVVEI